MSDNTKGCIQLAIADDLVSQDLTAVLEQHGYRVETRATAGPPEVAAEGSSHDLVVCDHPVFEQHEQMEAILEKAGSVCHDLNQPLQTVTGYCDLVMLDMDVGDSNYERFEKIRSEAERMGQIARRLMNLVRNRSLSKPSPSIGTGH